MQQKSTTSDEANTMSSMTIPIQSSITTTSLTSTSNNLHNSDTKYGNDDQTNLNKIVVPGLPSPTDSIGETSDYQRSTPSPRGEPNSKTGNWLGHDLQNIIAMLLQIEVMS